MWLVACPSFLTRPAELGKLGIAVRVFPLRTEIPRGSGGRDVERGVGVAALGEDAAVLEQAEHLRPRHDGEYGEEDGEVELLGRDQLPRLLTELEVDEEERHGDTVVAVPGEHVGRGTVEAAGGRPGRNVVQR